MSELQSAKSDKLSAARRKLKEFQEQKKLREKSRASPPSNNGSLNQLVTDNYLQQHAVTNNEKVTPQHHNGNSVNIAQYFVPNTQEIKNHQHPATDQSFYNQSFNNAQDSFQLQQNFNLKPYSNDNVFQLDHSNINSSPNLEPPTYTQAGSNIQYETKIDNLVSNTNKLNVAENSLHENQNIFYQNHSNNNPTYSTINNLQCPSSENITTIGDNGHVALAKDLGNTNYNILSVFTDSSASSHNSSTHTGPFLLNEESAKHSNVETSSQTADDKNGNISKDNIENYHLFEQTHNENYFGINFGNDQGPGIHMDVNPFEHRNERLVNDFLEFEARPDHSYSDTTHIQSTSSDDNRSDKPDSCINSNTPINLLNDTFRRNLMSLSTSKSTSIEEYTDKSTRGNSTVSKSVSLESSAGGGVGERGGVYFDDILGKDSTNSSTVFSSCDNLRKLLSSAAESSSEPACEESCVLEMEKKNEELRSLLAIEQEKNRELKALLTGEQGRSSGLEAQVSQMRHELQSIHVNQTDSLKHYAQESDQLHVQLKSQTHTIQILIEEKAQLEDKVKVLGDSVEEKGKEIEELKGRLAISKHKCANIERDVGVLQEQVKQSSRALNEVHDTVSLERKQLEELAEDKTALLHKLDTKSQELQQARVLLQERDSQLSLMHLKVQQLSAASGMFTSHELSDMQSLQQERDQLKATVTEMSEQVKTLTRERDKTLQYYGQMIDTIKTKNEELTSTYSGLSKERSSLHAQCEAQILHIAELEKQIQALRSHSQLNERNDSDDSALKPLVVEMETKIKDLTMEKQKLDTALQAQVLETELAQERVEQLTRDIERSEADRPDANALLSAMESDKIAASRAIQQNSALKQQLQELQDAVITLNNSKLELSELLIEEQSQSKQLRNTLDSVQSQLNQTQEQYQQLQQNEAQYHQQHNQVQLSEYGTNAVSPSNDSTELPSQTLDHSVRTVNEREVLDQNALRLLEDKFNNAMKDVAELSDEKQRLEHLVTQLQLETETIGEYAALYQKQRYLLQQKSREKDEQVKQLNEDQQALKQKLAKLNALVQDFVSQGAVSVKDVTSEIDGPPNTQTSVVAAPTETKASQIMELISEIEANRLVVPSTFHPCLLCSGQLITV